MCQSLDIGLDSLYSGKWRKISKSHHDLDLFSYTTICLSFEWLEPLFFELSCTQTDTHTQTHTHTPTHTQTDMNTL